jgi:hypothetical protein
VQIGQNLQIQLHKTRNYCRLLLLKDDLKLLILKFEIIYSSSMCQNRRKASSSDLEEKVIGVIHHEYRATMSLIPSDFAYNPFQVNHLS